MLVTILTVAFNSEKTIAKTIESVLNQTYPEIEYIVIDGASKDATVNIANSYKKAFDERHSYSLTVISEPDKGMYDALNKGARLAHGELVGQINSDDWYEPDAAENMVNLYKTERYDVAWGSLNMVSNKRTWIKHAKIGKIWTSAGWCHPAMFSRRQVLIKHPYALESMYDDFDYITAVYKSGMKIVTVDRIIGNFTFGNGGQSTKRNFREIKRRVDIAYSIYKKYGMSKFYYIYRIIYELAKCIIG